MAHTGTTALEQSIERVVTLLQDTTVTLESREQFEEIATELRVRRSLDLSSLSADEQFKHISSRVSHVITPERLRELLAEHKKSSTPMRIKFGIDPTGADVHLGHAVPIILAGRLQRMGHKLIIIIGDVTAKIGDPSGRTKERPSLTDEDIQKNLETYKEQMSPFVDFDKAELRKNSEWLLDITTPELLGLLARIPLSMQLQREDFRKRLDAGHSLSTAELLYSIYMAYDSVAVTADIEIGGVDQLLNMQMCRKVMEIRELEPEVLLTTHLIEGTDGTGDKMSKSKGNYVGLSEDAADMYGKIMSIPDRLLIPYLTTITELSDSEAHSIAKRMDEGTLNPMTIKHLLAFDVVSIVKGVETAKQTRKQFIVQFSKRAFGDMTDLPEVSLTKDGDALLLDILVRLGFAQSKSEARRLTESGGVQLVAEGTSQEIKKCTMDDVSKVSFGDMVVTFKSQHPVAEHYFLKVGRSVAKIV